MKYYKKIRFEGRLVNVQDYLAAKALGRNLKNEERVHHVDYNIHNNEPNNLVICPNEHYHRLMHTRSDALNACGNPDWRKCSICKQYDDKKNLSCKFTQTGVTYRHSKCQTQYNRQLKLRKQGN